MSLSTPWCVRVSGVGPCVPVQLLWRPAAMAFVSALHLSKPLLRSCSTMLLDAVDGADRHSMPGLVVRLLLPPCAKAVLAGSPAAVDCLQRYMSCIFTAMWITHVFEGAVAFMRAQSSMLPASQWGFQTFIVGFPSLRLLYRVCAARNASLQEGGLVDFQWHGP